MAAPHRELLAEALEVILALTHCVEDGDPAEGDRFVMVPLSTLADARSAALVIQAAAGL